MDATTLIRELRLTRHPEGGYYRETFRADSLPFELPGRGPRSASTAVYFLLEGTDFSAFHRVRSDEIWHFYAGSPVELHTLELDRGYELLLLGSAIEGGERPQQVVRAGVYQAARLAAPGFALCGCTVAPGFEFADFEMPRRAELAPLFPAFEALVETLTRG
jgi:predicted cupin superfamily sugar epimerase